jgi:NADPH:quinone reductase
LVRPPFILGLEFAGVVAESYGVNKFPVGSQVYGSTTGAFAEKIAIQPKLLNVIPKGWSYADAAGFAATAPVSLGALIHADLKKGETLLVHGAAGGLGLMAIQIAKAMGCRVIGTVGSSPKAEAAKRFGADEVVNYNEREDWETEINQLTNGEGVDVVYDSVGLVLKSTRCIKYGGRILIIGFAGTEGNIEKIAMNRILLKQIKVLGYVSTSVMGMWIPLTRTAIR